MDFLNLLFGLLTAFNNAYLARQFTWWTSARDFSTKHHQKTADRGLVVHIRVVAAAHRSPIPQKLATVSQPPLLVAFFPLTLLVLSVRWVLK